MNETFNIDSNAITIIRTGGSTKEVLSFKTADDYMAYMECEREFNTVTTTLKEMVDEEVEINS